MPNLTEQKIYRILEKALDLSLSAREAYLGNACAGDKVLYQQICDMIAAAEAPDSQLEQAIGQGIQHVLDAPPRPLQIGDRIGAYRLQGLLGRGGMGEVFLAKREDGVVMQAAVKVSLSSPENLALMKRFRQERDILASLKHPHIAQLYDGGTTVDGRPFFIMEYVEGVPIHEYCRKNRLNFEQRLGLFRLVCQALSYAHQNLILHRDIKPANILVTTEGVPKLLDFGISGLMNADTIAAKTYTVFGLTPGYASPEQLEHRRLTAASDIYSLGVLLYFLLTEQLPIPADDASPMDYFRKIEAHQINLPSEALADKGSSVAEAMNTTQTSLRRRLLGDMDTLVMTALAKSPEARFSSVEAFDLEIQRFQAGLPIQVREPTIGYRLRKFIARNRLPLVTGSFLVVLLGCFVLAMFFQKQQTALERNRARQERDTAEQVTQFLVETFQNADPNRAGGEALTARELLDQGAAKMDFQLKDQPRVRAKLLEIMGTAYRNLGELNIAEQLLEEALQLQKQDPDVAQQAVVGSLNALGLLYKDLGDYARAEPLLREAVANKRSHHEPDSLATSLNSLGLLLAEMGEKDEAKTLFQEAYSLREKVTKKSLAGIVNNLGLLLKDLGDYHEAEPFLQEALALHEQMHPSPHPAIATSLNNLGLLAKEKGNLSAAESYWRASLAMRRNLYEANHPKLMTSLNNLAAVLKDKGDLATAETLFFEVLQLKRAQFQPGHPRLITSLNNLAVLLIDKGDLERADPYLEEALAIAAKKLAEDHIFRWVLTRNQALLRLGQGRVKEGRQLAEMAVVGLAKKQKSGSLHLVLAEGILGGALLASGRYEAAKPLLETSYEYLNAEERHFPLHSERLRLWLEDLESKTDQASRSAVLN